MRIDLDFAANLLKKNDNILILTHSHPDADTICGGYALLAALRQLGKKARVECQDPIPRNCTFAVRESGNADFEPEFIVTVDIADEKLLGDDFLKKYGSKTNLCIDHHGSNTDYAEYAYVDSSSAAACEIIFDLYEKLGAEIDAHTAGCIYAGIATDTGCFLYANTTARTHEIAASLIAKGADISYINRVFFETRTKEYIALESTAMSAMRFYFDGLCAITSVSFDDFKRCGAKSEDFERIPSLTWQIEGVIVGAAIKEQETGGVKVSLRSYAPVNSSNICMRMGGGGHSAAAGCSLNCSLEEAEKTVLRNIKEELTAAGLVKE